MEASIGFGTSVGFLSGHLMRRHNQIWMAVTARVTRESKRGESGLVYAAFASHFAGSSRGAPGPITLLGRAEAVGEAQALAEGQPLD